jgi:DNA polymerase-3 subunit delta'
MPIPPLYGHEGIRNRLVGAIASGRLPQALLFEGPRGVGKQRLALWLAQALVCENPGKGRGTGKGEPCGECQPCKLVLNLSHPDVHWFVPVEPAKKGADADKQVDLAAEALAEQLATRREQPLYESPSGLASHGIASVRLMLRRLVLKPALGRRKLFLIGDAERLVPQTGAEAAANALLKALEEPPPDTVFVLTSSEPDALLPTILSRVVRVRVARNADSIVAAFAQRELGLKSQRDIAERVTAADGSIGKLLAAGEGAAGGTGQATAAFQAAVAHGAVQRYGFALRQAPFQARGGFSAMLDGLLEQLREQARGGGETTRVVEAIARTLDARELAQGNVNPQLVAAVLADQLAELT